MIRTIRAGSVLLHDGTLLPPSLAVTTEQYSTDWSFIVSFPGARLNKAIETAGWTFFFMAGDIRTRGFSLNAPGSLARAVLHLTDAVTGQHCNCLEISSVSQRSFLGLHWTSLAAHARHLQESSSFHALPSVWARVSQKPTEWLYSQKASSPGRPVAPGEAVTARENEGGSQGTSAPKKQAAIAQEATNGVLHVH